MSIVVKFYTLDYRLEVRRGDNILIFSSAYLPYVENQEKFN